MGIQTNGWDYGYHISHKQSNKILKDKSTNDLTELSTVLAKFGNLNVSGTDQATLDISIVKAIKSNVTNIIGIDGFKELQSDFLDNLVISAHDNTVLGYLLSILEAILNFKHIATNKRELLSLWNVCY